MSILRNTFILGCMSTIMVTSTFAATSTTSYPSLYLEASQYAQGQPSNENLRACGNCHLIGGSPGMWVFALPRSYCASCS